MAMRETVGEFKGWLTFMGLTGLFANFKGLSQSEGNIAVIIPFVV